MAVPVIAVPFPDNTPVCVVVRVIAGVLVALATVPANPLEETTDTVVTVPDVAGLAQDGGEPVVAVKTWPVVPSARIDGTPPELVISTPLLAVDSPATVFDELLYRIWLEVVEEGKVAVLYEGLADAPPDCRTCPDVPGPTLVMAFDAPPTSTSCCVTVFPLIEAVPFPIKTPVREPAPVPPLGTETGTVEVTELNVTLLVGESACRASSGLFTGIHSYTIVKVPTKLMAVNDVLVVSQTNVRQL
jgi:hypothetical protein